MPDQRKRTTYGRQTRSQANIPAATPIPVARIAIAAALLVAVVLVLRICSSAMTIDVTVNGAHYTIHGAKTLQTAIKESGLPVNPGDLISIRGVVLRKSEGKPFTATVNGAEETNPDCALHDGDVLEISDGKDVVEEYDSEENYTPHSAVISGAGAIRTFTPGSDGVTEIRTGRVSGEQVERLRSETSDAYCLKYNPEVGTDKVLALTFDGGPSDEYTAEILDILKENDAHATFFCVSSEIEKYRDGLVQRERDEGHMVCTGTFDYERVSGGSSSSLTEPESLAGQIQKTYDLIGGALGEDARHIVRLPNGLLNEQTVSALDALVETEIGWNVDTGDWMESEQSAVYRVLMDLESGDIVRCHDGGGDHSGTVDALREALPKLREQGYSFVTIDDLLDYPAQ